MGGSSSSSAVSGYKYYMAVEVTLCLGPIDSIEDILIADRSLGVSASSNTTLDIDNEELFGGEKREGGVSGGIEVRMGGADQLGSSYVATIMQVPEVPANRGVVTLLFRGRDPPIDSYVSTETGATTTAFHGAGGGTSHVGGGRMGTRITNVIKQIFTAFYWAANNPYIKPVSIWAYRSHHWNSGEIMGDPQGLGAPVNVWYESKVDVPWAVEGPTNMNPAHMIYQCLTDQRWGMGYPYTINNDQSFRDAADVFYNEGFGLSMLWKQQNTIKAFVQEILKHIGAVLYEDEATGQICLYPVRGGDAPVAFFDQYNIKAVTKFQHTGWGDTVNEVVVKYTDPTTGDTSSVAVQDLANIQIQGRVVSQPMDYPGIPYQQLAYRVADRDLRSLSTPLIAATIIVGRSASPLHEGQVIDFTWPEEDVTSVSMRILKIQKGDPRNPDITLDLIQDVFSLTEESTGAYEGGGATEVGAPPDYVTEVNVLEVPYFKLAQQLSAAELSAIVPDDSFPLILAKQPGVQNTSFEVYSSPDTISSNFDLVGSASYTPTALLNGAIGPMDTVILYDTSNGVSPVYFSGTCALIGSEWVSITAVDTVAGTIDIERGVFDSIPATHADNSVIWFYAGVYGWADASGEAVEGETVYYREAGVSSAGNTGIEPPAGAQSHVHAASWYAPYPPAKVQINAAYFPAQLAQGAYNITWVGRNRLTQLADYIGWTEAHANEEAGATYSLLVTNAISAATLITETGITISSPNGLRTYTQTDDTIIRVRVRLWAVRDGRDSNVYDFTFDVTRFYASAPHDAEDSVVSTLVSGGVNTVLTDQGDAVAAAATETMAITSERTQQNDRVAASASNAASASASGLRDGSDIVVAVATSS